MKYLLPLFALLFGYACLDDDDTRVSSEDAVELNVDFRAAFGGEDLTIQDVTYQYPLNDIPFKNTLFQYYVSDLELLPADGGDPVLLTEIDLLRYESAGAGATVNRRYEVPGGDYRGVRFGLGVKPSLNARNPNEFAADYVLNENEFWNANARYVFAKIEANVDLENDGTFDTGLSYHLGSDDLYRELTLSETFTVEAGSRIIISADVFDAFSVEEDFSDAFDISDPDRQRVHGGNQAVATELWDRLAGSFRLTVR